MEQDSALSLDLALNSTGTFSLCWEGFGISSKLLLVWAKTCTLCGGNCFWGKHGLGPPLQAALPWGGDPGCWGDTWQPSGKVTASCRGLLPCTAEGAPWEPLWLRLHPHPLCPSAPRVLCPLGSQPSAPGIRGLLRDLTQLRGGRKDLGHPSPFLSSGVLQLQVTPHSQRGQGYQWCSQRSRI